MEVFRMLVEIIRCVDSMYSKYQEKVSGLGEGACDYKHEVNKEHAQEVLQAEMIAKTRLHRTISGTPGKCPLAHINNTVIFKK